MLVDELLEARKYWRNIVKLAYPLDYNKPVIIGANSKATVPFESYTDNQTIFININKPKEFESEFPNFAVPHYKDASTKLYYLSKKIGDSSLEKSLEFDFFLFVLFHELYHPLVCPNSREDEKQISHAIYDGLRDSNPNLGAKEYVYLVNNCKNLIWDFILNIVFIARSAGFKRDILKDKIGFVFKERKRMIENQDVLGYPKGILPLIYLISAKNRKTDVLISLIGMFYATLSYNEPNIRKRSIEIFLDDLEKKGIDKALALETLKEMYKGLVLGLGDKTEFLKRSELVVDFYNVNYEKNQDYFIEKITEIFDTYEWRYPAVEGLIKALSAFMSFFEKQGSIDQNTSSWGDMPREAMPGEAGDNGGEEGEGKESGEDSSESKKKGKNGGKGGEKSEEEMGAGSLAETIDDLSDKLGKKEMDKVLDEMSKNPNPSTTSTGKKSGAGKGAGGKGTGSGGGFGQATIDTIATFAKDELYKRNAEPIDIRGPRMGFAIMDLGKQVRWEFKGSQDLTSAELASLDITKIVQTQITTGLPILMELTKDRYKLNEFYIAESPVRGWAPQQYDTEIPDNWVLFLDSSGSMCGSPFELLLRTTYGIKKGIFEICKKFKKDLKFGVVNFSSATIYSGMDSFVKIYTSRIHKTKQVLFQEQNGGTHIEISVFDKIKKELKPGKVVYTLITDGYIDNEDAVYKEVEKIALTKENAFLFIEISANSQLGQNIEKLSKTFANVIYKKVDKVEDIKDQLNSILIKYIPR